MIRNTFILVEHTRPRLFDSSNIKQKVATAEPCNLDRSQNVRHPKGDYVLPATAEQCFCDTVACVNPALVTSTGKGLRCF